MTAPIKPGVIAALPPAPRIDMPDEFDPMADKHVAALGPMVTQQNAANEATYQNAVSAYESAQSAIDSRDKAKASADVATGAALAATQNAEASTVAAQRAAVSAEAAMGTQVVTMSVTQMQIDVGVKSFTVEAGKQFKQNVPVMIVSAANAKAFMYGTVKSYVGKILEVDVTHVGGALSSAADWNVSISGLVGPPNAPASNTQFDVYPLATAEIDCGLGFNYFKKTIAAATSFTFKRVPAGFSFTLELQYDDGSVAWPASVFASASIMPTLYKGKTYLFFLVTSNGGVTWRLTVASSYANG